MKDEEFSALKLKMSVIPEQTTWGEPRFDHQIAMHACADEVRAFVGGVYGAIDAIDQDINLTDKGKENARAKVAAQALVDFEKSQTLERARTAVKRQCQKWDEKFGISEIVKPAGDIQTATIHAEIRSKVAKMSREERLAFLSKHGGDPLVASSLLLAPAFLTDASEAELAMVRSKIEKSVIPAEVITARAETEKALASCERGWARAIQLVSECGGLKAPPVKTKVEA